MALLGSLLTAPVKGVWRPASVDVYDLHPAFGG
jgi:hypothetical protein